MIRTPIILIALLAAGPPLAKTQIADWCSSGGTVTHIHTPSSEIRDRSLEEAGYTLTKDSLLSALKDSRPSVRALAAMRLASGGKNGDVPPLMRAWFEETDSCSKSLIDLALSDLVAALSRDASQHPGGQPRVKPFQVCTPSEPPIISVAVESANTSSYSGTMVLVSVRNLTTQTLPFVKASSPAEMFSVSVLDPLGRQAKVPKDQQWMYEPLEQHEANRSLIRSTLAFLPLPPGGSVSWYWDVGSDFEMSTAGGYRVSLGGKIPYLNTTVCSNVAEVVVK